MAKDEAKWAYWTKQIKKWQASGLSRIARGLPVGGELEHVDSGTLAQAVLERRNV